VTFLVFTLSAVASPMNLGIRHLSVSIAALTILMSLIVPWCDSLSNARAKLVVRGVVLVAVVGACVSMAAGFPDYIGYLNMFKGGKANYEITADLDMGQLMIEVREFMRAHQVNSIKIDMRGSVRELYLPMAQEFNCEEGVPPDTEWVALGAGRFVIGRDSRLDLTKPIPHCIYLMKYPHWVSCSGSLYVFQVGEQARAKALQSRFTH
jgi:hypothetical protein